MNTQDTQGKNTAIENSLKGWEQIEDSNEVKRILEDLQNANRFDVYKCAEKYDLAYPGYEGDKDYYVEKTKEGKALYLGVGTGRIFGEMAKNNPSVVGLEKSPQMVDLLFKRYPHLNKNQIILADALEAPLAKNQFDTVVAPYSFLQVINEDQVPELLKNVQNWLKPNGRFYTDMFSSYLIPFRKKGIEANIRNINGGTRIAIYVLYDHKNQNMTEMTLINQGESSEVLQMNLHYYFPHEISAALQEAGFESHQIVGGYKGEEFDPSENEVFVFEASKLTNAAMNGQILKMRPKMAS